MKKIYKKNASIIFISIILFSMFFGFGANFFLNNVNISYNENLMNTNELKTSQIEKTHISIAIYNEANTTEPTFSDYSTLTNNYTGLTTLLDATGYDYTELTTDDILNHKLLTADFDVFIMVDNLPKDNIVNFVKEYWLGGGGILSFDSALSYLMYAGILIPESEGDENYGTYWSYSNSITQNISIRHPSTKKYEVGDIYTLTKLSNAAVIWSSITGTTFEDDIIKLTNVENLNDIASGVALDPTQKGGKVIHLPGTVEEIDPTYEDLILDSIQWLCPTPNARILFDLAHQPWYGIDPWDTPSDYPNRYYIFRDNLVNRSYTFDKHWKGNYTLNILNEYDILILAAGNINYTSFEISVIQNWVKNGGSLFGLGLRGIGSFGIHAERLNDVFEQFDLSIAPDISGDSSLAYVLEHPISEDVNVLDTSYSSPGFVNYSGTAEAIIGDNPINILAAAQNSGNGRVVLCGDMFFLRYTHINNDDNLQFALNVINWLSASKAKVLLYTDEYSGSGISGSGNHYQCPVVDALNELYVSFYLTTDYSFLNLSMHLYSWDLLIIDSVWWVPSSAILNETKKYVDSGGKLLMSIYWLDERSTHPLWSTLGFSYSAEMPDSSPLEIWNTGHSIFNNPNVFGANNFTPSIDYDDEGDLLEVFPNATALAGYTETAQKGNATIVLRNDRRTLFNGYLIDQFRNDIDDSTYPDSLEIWMNQIYYMLPKTTSSGGIPGYDLMFFSVLAFSTIGLISVYIYRNKIRK
ncbi:MAG: hypothetical protein GF316_21555 [Candidatus Lokiarchaeota archaeon]|nr:hypothetical protein [Candidatus Lokiarchaeota archaeon]